MLLAALYEGSKPLGMGMIHYDPKPMEIKEAIEELCRGSYFDYLKGRVMKIQIPIHSGWTKEMIATDKLPEGSEIDEWMYDRDLGKGALKRVVDTLRKKPYQQLRSVL